LDGGLMSRSNDELQIDKKEKMDKTKIKKLLSVILPSSSDQNPLPNPFTVNEHFCIPTGQFPILVHDQDLSSIIAYSLMSYDYKRLLTTPSEAHATNNSPSLKRKNPSDSSIEVDATEKETNNSGSASKKNTFNHIEIHFQDSTTQFTCKSYFPKEFDELRNNCLTLSKKYSNDDIARDEIRKNYARSLSQSNRWEARGGKSGSKFSKTHDDRFILKEMSKQDVGEFEKCFAPHYFEYVNLCLQKRQPTLLAKIFGVYKVVIKKKDSVTEKAVLVIENLFCGRKITNKYDLKGSERNRLVDPTIQSGETVLLDENLIKSMLITFFY
jgi:1-phosphatidylinositol-3-phosphate 5-kinase